MNYSFLSKKDLNQIYTHAKTTYPEECCGIVIGNDDYNIICKCENIQNQLHEKDPKTYPRDAKTAYYVAPKEFMDIKNIAEKDNMDIKAFYHSHPDHDIYFSEEDKKNALFFDTPTFPGTLYAVVSIYGKKIKDVGFFSWDDKKKDFVLVSQFLATMDPVI